MGTPGDRRQARTVRRGRVTRVHLQLLDLADLDHLDLFAGDVVRQLIETRVRSGPRCRATETPDDFCRRADAVCRLRRTTQSGPTQSSGRAYSEYPDHFATGQTPYSGPARTFYPDQLPGRLRGTANRPA